MFVRKSVCMLTYMVLYFRDGGWVSPFFFFLSKSALLRQLHRVQLCCHMTQGLIVSLLSSLYHTCWTVDTLLQQMKEAFALCVPCVPERFVDTAGAPAAKSHPGLGLSARLQVESVFCEVSDHEWCCGAEFLRAEHHMYVPYQQGCYSTRC